MNTSSNNVLLDLSLSELLRSLRKKSNWSVPTLSVFSGISAHTIYKIETGVIKNPGFHTIQKLLNVLSYDVKITKCIDSIKVVET